MKVIKDLPETFTIIEHDDVNFELVSVLSNASNIFRVNEYVKVKHGICHIVDVREDKSLVILSVQLIKDNVDKTIIIDEIALLIQLAMIDVFDKAFKEGFNECADSEYSNGASLDNIGKDEVIKNVFETYFSN